jgi:hypothetical protein
MNLVNIVNIDEMSRIVADDLIKINRSMA